VKYSKSQIMSRACKIPELKFEDQNLTSLVSFQPLVLALELKTPIPLNHLSFFPFHR